MQTETQIGTELQCNSTPHRVANRRESRFLSVIDKLDLRLLFIDSPHLTSSDLAKEFKVSRQTIGKHTTRRGLSHKDSRQTSMEKLFRLWAEEAPSIHLSAKDFIPIAIALMGRRDPQFLRNAMAAVVPELFAK